MIIHREITKHQTSNMLFDVKKQKKALICLYQFHHNQDDTLILGKTNIVKVFSFCQVSSVYFFLFFNLGSQKNQRKNRQRKIVFDTVKRRKQRRKRWRVRKRVGKRR